MIEVWKPVKGYEGYEVSDKGSVRSYRWQGRIIEDCHYLVRSLDTRGYEYVSLCLKGKPKKFFVHRLVLEAFVGLRPEGYDCCHYDGNPLNNWLSNISWDTHAKNMRDRDRHGTHNKGSNHGMSKLNESIVREIKSDLEKGALTTELAKKHKISRSVISNIKNNKSWKHITLTKELI